MTPLGVFAPYRRRALIAFLVGACAWLIPAMLYSSGANRGGGVSVWLPLWFVAALPGICVGMMSEVLPGSDLVRFGLLVGASCVNGVAYVVLAVMPWLVRDLFRDRRSRRARSI
jgi:hypothetical protein